MDLAKPGEIKEHCDPNAVSTFLEYLIDYGSDEAKQIGEVQIQRTLEEMTPTARERTEKIIAQVNEGKRDVYC
jgi:2-iminoacetate synthase